MSHEGIRIAPKDPQAPETEERLPLSRIAVTPEKVRVLLTEGKGMEIDWADGHRSAWSFAWLREACPCATCIEERAQEGRKPGQPKAKPAERAAHVHPAGEARQRPRRGPLCDSVQLARRPLRRDLFLGVSAPQLPVQGMHLCGGRDERRAELGRTCNRYPNRLFRVRCNP
jgi:hypothetical protein